MLTVEKIGGTSMSALKEVIDNIIFHERTGDALYNRVFVVSAFSGVTNLLLENKKTKAPGVYGRVAARADFQTPLVAIVEKLKEINAEYAGLGLDVAKADNFIIGHVAKARTYLESAAVMLASGYVNEGVLQAAREFWPPSARHIRPMY
jgi:aspartate kinase